MSTLSKADQVKYDALADRAEHGELKPQGEGLHVDDAASVGREWVLAATGASNLEEATQLAMNRPRLGDEGGATKT